MCDIKLYQEMFVWNVKILGVKDKGKEEWRGIRLVGYLFKN